MSMKMAILILLVAIGLPSMLKTIAAAASLIPPRLTKSINCTAKCGDVIIPFPFGIEAGCFLNDWYEVECLKNGNGTLPMLKKINVEVLNISLENLYTDDRQAITVKLPTFDSNSTNCIGNRSNAPVSLEGSHFHFSQSANVFIAIGCNMLAVMGNLQPQSAVIGCKSDCRDGGGISSTTYSYCTGFDGCCHTNISHNNQIYSPGFSKETTQAASGDVDVDGDQECEYAFLVDKSRIGQDKIDLSTLKMEDYQPAVLHWWIPNVSYDGLSFDNYHYSNDPYGCVGYGPIPGSVGCFCREGYRGNPYLINGCEDINECEDSILNTCSGRCINRLGTFDCVDRARTLRLVAIGVGGGLGALLLFALLWHIWKFIKRKKTAKRKERFFKKNGGLLLQQQLSSFEGNLHKGKIFSSDELEKATDNFNKSRILGKGGQGTVYKGMLTSGKIVAVKKAMDMDKKNIDTFINEVIILSQINHRNVVKLLGCCLETEVPLLVYEFIPNGTLYHYIQNPTEFSISWDERLRIASDIAGALAYLHSSASIPIYHRDIKSTNILLDEKYRAKVADFGTSKLVSLDQTHVTTIIQGTFGYLDPEFFRSGQFTDKSDVYSFGVILVELLTGQEPIPSLLASEGKSLAMHFLQSMEEDCLFDVLHAHVIQQGKKEDIIDVANLAKQCLNLEGRKRPTMKEVASELERIRKTGHPLNTQLKEVVYENDDDCAGDVSIAAPFEIVVDGIPLSIFQTLFPNNT